MGEATARLLAVVLAPAWLEAHGRRRLVVNLGAGELLRAVVSLAWVGLGVGALVWGGLSLAGVRMREARSGARTHLPWLVFGRRARPYALAVSLAAASLAGVILSNRSVWGNSGDVWSVAVAGTAAVAAALLWVGFWARSHLLMQHGLLLTAAVFAARGAYIALVGGSWATAALSWCWTVASAGAFLLESAWQQQDEGGGGDGE